MNDIPITKEAFSAAFFRMFFNVFQNYSFEKTYIFYNYPKKQRKYIFYTSDETIVFSDYLR